MSIGFRKITELVESEVSKLPALSQEQKERLTELCKKIYMMESSVESISRQRMIEDIMGAIGHATDSLKPQAK